MPRDRGFIVTLEGHQATITEQLRLLPFSQNILCLPPLELPQAPPLRESRYPSDQQSPLDPAVRQFIFSLHHAHVDRLERAKSFLAERPATGCERMVFLNGGFAAAQVACLETLRNALVSEEKGNLENAAREAEWVFEEIMQGGVQGLLDLETGEQEQGSAYGTLQISHIPSDVESVSDEVERKETVSGEGEKKERTPWAEDFGLYHQPLDTITPRPTPENTPKIPEVAEIGEIECSVSPSKNRKPRVVSGPRNPTPEEIAAGIEICKASVAVRVRTRSNTAAGSTSRYSPPPSPPIVRTELVGHHRGPETFRKRSSSMPPGFGDAHSEKPKRSKRKGRKDNFILPPIESVCPIEIPTPPSSARAIPDAKIAMFSAEYHSVSVSAPELTRPVSRISTRPSSPTPSSTADVSGATILPSPRYLSGGFDAPPQFFKEPVDPLFPSVDENLVIYFPSPDAQKSDNSDSRILEKALGDFAVSFTPQTPGVSRSNPLLLKGHDNNQRTFLSPATAYPNYTAIRDSFQSTTSSIGTSLWSLRSSLGSSHPDPPLSSIPTITSTSEKSPADVQNELRAIMRHHFSPASSTIANTKTQHSVDDHSVEDEEEDEDMRWLTEDSETDRIWRPILSARGINQDPAYSAIDLIVAVAAEEDGETAESRKGLELRQRLVEQLEEMPHKKGQADRGGQVGLKYLLSNTLPQMRAQHPGTPGTAVLKGHFLLPELEHYLSFNPQLRVLVVEFDFYTGSSAILELQRVLGPNIDILKIACVADAVTQFTSKPLKPSKPPKAGVSNGIRIRTSMGATTTSYTFGPGTPTTPTAPSGKLHISSTNKTAPAKLARKQRPWGPKQRLISRADVVIPPFATVSSGLFVDAVEALHAALKSREKMTGFYGESKENEDQVPATPGLIVRNQSKNTFEKELEKETVCRQDTSYYLEEETDEEDCQEGRRASFRRRVKNGSKALKWLGLE